MRRLARTVVAACAAVACAASAALVGGPIAVARAAPQCEDPGQPFQGTPWHQRTLAPERIWPFTQGGSQIVAVLDSGVDAGHPQLEGRVLAGFDAVRNGGAADTDCFGTGTQVAGVIAALRVEGTGFSGLAPGARILPVRVVPEDGLNQPVSPQVLARGITAAVNRGADVIVVSVAINTDSAAVQAAVERARERNVPVVASVGDQGDAPGGGPPPYPASYDGVIGVGAIDQNGVRWSNSQVGGYVDLVAPGAQVVTLQREGGMTVVNGTGVAAGFVGATAALIRARRPDLDPSQVADALRDTAIGGMRGTEYGSGVVNPYEAVHDEPGEASPASLPAMARPSTEEPAAWVRARNLAMTGAGVAVLAVLVVLCVAVALPRGRRRFWRPAVAAEPRDRPEEDEPAPPALLFDEQR